MRNIAIKTQNLTKTYKVPTKGKGLQNLFFPKYKPIEAVKNISFEIAAGESIGFLGPNGAGKTTTIKMLTGLLYPTSGKLSILGYTPVERDPEFLKQIGLVMGNKTGLSWDLSPRQSYELFTTVYALDANSAKEYVDELARILEVTDQLDTQVRKLSLGQRMKAELIGAILHKPKVLFLDEPTLGLDVVAKKNIREFLRRINKEDHTTLLLTSHDMDDVEDVCDRVIIIHNGKLIFDDLLDRLKNKYRERKYITFVFKEKSDCSGLGKYGRIHKEKPLSCTIEIPAATQSKVIGEVTKAYSVDDIDIMSPPLDEIITDIFKNPQ